MRKYFNKRHLFISSEASCDPVSCFQTENRKQSRADGLFSSVYPSVRFHEDEHNCFSFCLKFINSVLAAEGQRSLSKEALTQSFILPRMRRVSKYTTLYQHIQRHQFYMVDRQEDSPTEPAEDA